MNTKIIVFKDQTRNNYSLWGHRNTGWGGRKRLFHLLAAPQSHQRRIPVRVVVWAVWGYWQAAGSLRIRGYLQAHLKTESWGRWTDSQHKPPRTSRHSKNSCGTTLCSISARCPLCPLMASVNKNTPRRVVPACGLAGKPWQKIKMGQKWFSLHCELSGSGDFGNSSRPQTGLGPNSIPKKRVCHLLIHTHPRFSSVWSESWWSSKTFLKSQSLLRPPVLSLQLPPRHLPMKVQGPEVLQVRLSSFRWQPGPFYMPFRPTLLSEHLGNTS